MGFFRAAFGRELILVGKVIHYFSRVTDINLSPKVMLLTLLFVSLGLTSMTSFSDQCVRVTTPIKKWEAANANNYGYGSTPLEACRLEWGAPKPCTNQPGYFCSGTDHVIPVYQTNTAYQCINWTPFGDGYTVVGSNLAQRVNLCPAGYDLNPGHYWDETDVNSGVTPLCVLSNTPPAQCPNVVDVNKNIGAPRCNGTNPINDANGNKFQLEIDYIGTGPFPLQLTRAYNSQQEGGGGWRWS
ncbi:DUF6531 domain-containing protein, partial [Sulfurirhabdus autotrophica]